MSLSDFGVAPKQLTPAQRWLSFIGVFLIGCISAYNLLKVSSCLTVIAGDFGMDLSTAGYFTSLFTLAGAILAFPGAWIMRRCGLKFSLLISVIVMTIGSLTCYFAGSAAMFLIGRALEGCGFGMISVLGPNAIPRLFEARQRGLAFGIFSQWIPVGSVLAFFVAPMLFNVSGWRSLFVLGTILGVVVILWTILWIKAPAIPENVLEFQGQDAATVKIKGKSYLGLGLVCAIIFIAYAFIWGTVCSTFYPTYLQAIKGLDVVSSSLPILISSIICMPCGIIFGALIDKTHTAKWCLFVAYVVLAILVATVGFTMDPGNMWAPWVFMIIMGPVQATIPVASRCYIPSVVKAPGKVDYTLALMAFLTNFVALFAGVLGALVAATSWHTMAMILLLPMAAIAAIVALVVLKADKPIVMEEMEEDAAVAPASSGKEKTA